MFFPRFSKQEHSLPFFTHDFLSLKWFGLDLGTNTQGIQMRNMKAVSLTIQNLWPMFKFFTDKQTGKNYD